MKDTDKVIHLNERQNRIMEIMRQQNAVSVATLSSLMKVSEVTIRKDLTMLEEQHMLYRVHGSAILVNRYINDRSVAEKEKLYADEKHAIGVYAARLIGPDDTIMIASGTTTLAMAREIGQNDRLTVITSAFSVASDSPRAVRWMSSSWAAWFGAVRSRCWVPLPSRCWAASRAASSSWASTASTWITA